MGRIWLNEEGWEQYRLDDLCLYCGKALREGRVTVVTVNGEDRAVHWDCEKQQTPK